MYKIKSLAIKAKRAILPTNHAALIIFHKNPSVVQSNLDIFKSKNKDIPVYGLFGGSLSDYNKWGKRLMGFKEVTYFSLKKPARWKWKNTDLMVRWWYSMNKDKFEFKHITVLQWDILFAEEIDTMFRGCSARDISLTGPIDLSDIMKRWYWTTNKDVKDEFRLLRAYCNVMKLSPVALPQKACYGPLYRLSRDFLEEYIEAFPVELCHDEIRLPLYADLLGFNIIDTGVYSWFDEAIEEYFNADNKEISDLKIKAELSSDTGRRIFHPVRHVVTQ